VRYHTRMETTTHQFNQAETIAAIINLANEMANEEPVEHTGYEADEDGLLYWDQHAEG